ncbi:hypothetical protein HWC14_gp48 [Serratia phage Parlo]|uniref:Uncharacterized protein n=1 Tax=Serratia phage Parlo TaxID=2557554 RepID=A0A482MI21_9CAUD|nr:hypothetical protein HWC14_gp48 [Serratia phage Parlo]QBQ72197.1 hypothetical protein CPT_Parlo_048 [Serratia phage Parlo]
MLERIQRRTAWRALVLFVLAEIAAVVAAVVHYIN